MAAAPFRLGGRELYLPNITITLLRTPHLSPSQATFTVPIWFNKLDMRDYLYNVYGVRTFNIRSYVKLQRISQGTPPPTHIHSSLSPLVSTVSKPQYRRWHRPESIKRMTVELERAFVWPELPEDYSDWSKEEANTAEKEQREFQERADPNRSDMLKPKSQTTMTLREQAQRLLDGKEVWKPSKQL